MIETTACIGKGTEKDPVRIVKQYWDLDGNLLAERDEDLFADTRSEMKAETTVEQPDPEPEEIREAGYDSSPDINVYPFTRMP